MAARKKTRKSGTKKKARAKKPAKKPVKKPGAGTGRGNLWKPTADQRVQVKLLVGLGLTHREIASVMTNPLTGKGISVNTLEKHCRPELDDGGAFVTSKVGQSLVRKAISDNHPSAAVCAMFYLKCRAGWRQEDKIVHEIEGGTGVLVAPAALTPAQWIAQAQERNKNKKSPVDD